MKEIFQKQGFFRTKINPNSLTSCAESDCEIIRENFSKLAIDPYTNSGNNRFRAYSNLIILPWEREIKWLPLENYQGEFVSSYWQGAFNPEHADFIRRFTPISSAAKNTRLLNNLILHDYSLTFWKDKAMYPIYIGVHFIKLIVLKKGQLCYSSPDLMHRDGEAFTFAHLFNRSNIRGGANYISKVEHANYKLEDIPSNDILDKFEMYDMLESYGVCDRMVSHYISPVELEDSDIEYGCREIILIDFSPLRQVVE